LHDGRRAKQLIWIVATDLLSSARLPQATLFSFGTNHDRRRRTMQTSVFSSVIVLTACSFLAGCASIVSGRKADIAIDSYPSNAHVIIRDNNGREVASLNTPGVVSLKRNRRYFLPAKYTATIESPGFAPSEVAIGSKVNPWILGNIVIGGVPGLIVDNATGAAWQPSRSEIHTQLAPLGGPDQGMMYSNNQSMPPTPTESPQYVADRTGQAAPSQSGSQDESRPTTTR
jgi:hypothetical protein